MSYRIQYFYHGKFMDTLMGHKSLPETHADATAGLILHGATSAAILDTNDKHKLVEMLTRECLKDPEARSGPDTFSDPQSPDWPAR
jgi:hypothetical protein